MEILLFDVDDEEDDVVKEEDKLITSPTTNSSVETKSQQLHLQVQTPNGGRNVSLNRNKFRNLVCATVHSNKINVNNVNRA